MMAGHGQNRSGSDDVTSADVYLVCGNDKWCRELSCPGPPFFLFDQGHFTADGLSVCMQSVDIYTG